MGPKSMAIWPLGSGVEERAGTIVDQHSDRHVRPQNKIRRNSWTWSPTGRRRGAISSAKEAKRGTEHEEGFARDGGERPQAHRAAALPVQGGLDRGRDR